MTTPTSATTSSPRQRRLVIEVLDARLCEDLRDGGVDAVACFAPALRASTRSPASRVT
jgi:hypothetical protein